MIQKVLLFLFCFSLLFSCHIPRYFFRNAPEINDNRFFSNYVFNASDTPFYFKENIQNEIGDKITVFPSVKGIAVKSKPQSLNQYFKSTPTVAMLLIRNDTIVYERYKPRFGEDFLYASFSLAKSICLYPLIGIAVDEGLIHSIDDPITHYLTEYQEIEGFDKITIRDLLNFKSGIKEDDHPASPWSSQLKYYYGKHLENYVLEHEIARPPGEQYKYSMTVSSQMLGFIIERATGKKLGDYMDQKLWSKLGMESQANWSMDREGGNIKAFCCFHAKARDYAKLGRLFLNKGNWNGQQIVSKEWIEQLHQGTTLGDSIYTAKTKVPDRDFNYMHWYIGTKGYGDIKGSGLFGQYVQVFPKENTIMVTFTNRIGYSQGIYQVDLYYDILSEMCLFE